MNTRRSKRKSEVDRVDAVLDRVRAAVNNAADPRHAEAVRLSHKLATDFSVPAKTLLECSTFWDN